MSTLCSFGIALCFDIVDAEASATARARQKKKILN